MTPAAAFNRLSAAGFTTELVPIIPPGAKLSPNSRVKPRHTGKVPGVYHSGTHDEWAGFTDWTSLQADASMLRNWSEWPGVGVGVQCRQVVALDFDVHYGPLASAAYDRCIGTLGPAPRRVGQPPRFLLPYRLAGCRTRHLNFVHPEHGPSALDILGVGSQFVAEGIHHRTGNPYEWDQPLTMAGLTAIEAGQLDTLTEWFGELMARAGFARVNGGTSPQPSVAVPDAVPEGFEPDKPEYAERATLFLKRRAKPAVEGQGGNALTVLTANMLGDMGLTCAVAFRLMLEHWNPRCVPPWDRDELQATVTSAYRSRRSPIGCHARGRTFAEILGGEP